MKTIKNNLFLFIGILVFFVSIIISLFAWTPNYDIPPWSGPYSSNACITWIRSPINDEEIYAPVNVEGIVYDTGPSASGVQAHFWQVAKLADTNDTALTDSWIIIAIVKEYGMTEGGTGSETGMLFPPNFWNPNPGYYLCRLFGVDNAGNINVNIPSNIVLNPYFNTNENWSYGTGWSWDSTNKEADHSTNGTGTLTETIEITASDTYLVTYEVKNCTAYGVYFTMGGITGTTRTANGIYEQQIFTSNTNTLAFVLSSTSARLSIDNVSVVKTTFSGLTAAGNVTDGWYGTTYGDPEKVNIIKVEVK